MNFEVCLWPILDICIKGLFFTQEVYVKAYRVFVFFNNLFIYFRDEFVFLGSSGNSGEET